MTGTNPGCEVCGHANYYAGVACVPGLPISISWCTVCLVMGAMPDFYWKVQEVSHDEDTSATWFNRAEDRYYLGTQPQDVVLKHSKSQETLTFMTRGSVVIPVTWRS